MTAHQIEHLSYSSLTTYDKCPREFYLSRVKRAEALPGWYFIVGSTVHEAIEMHLLGTEAASVAVEPRFMRHVEESMDVEPDVSKWSHATDSDGPVIEERALQLAQVCFDRALEYLEDFEVWAIEPDITGYLPGCTMPIKAYPDLVGEHKKHGPLIVDWKTGKTRGNRFQLETYNGLIRHGSHDNKAMHPKANTVFRGQFVMLNPAASSSRPLLLKETPESLGEKYGRIEERVRKGVYPAMPGYACEWCTMKPNCSTMSGANKRTAYYDTPTKDGLVPF